MAFSGSLGGHNDGGGTRGEKKCGAPNIKVFMACAWLMNWRPNWLFDSDAVEFGSPSGDALTVSQNSRRRATRRSGGLPAIRAEFIAPMEIPATQLG